MTAMPTETVDLTHNDLNLVIKGERVTEVEIPSGYVPIDFNANISEHLMLPGDQLSPGMIVLVADHSMRENPNIIRDDGYSRRRLVETSRWAMVLHVYETSNDVVNFTALYADGSMVQRRYHKSVLWVVLPEANFKVEASDDFQEFMDRIHGVIEGSLSSLVEIRPDDEQTDSPDDGFQDEEYLEYCARDARATQAMYEATKSEKKPKPTWVEGLSADELCLNDWLPMGGYLYRIIGIQHTESQTILTINHLNDPEIPASTLFLPAELLFKVKRRVQQ